MRSSCLTIPNMDYYTFQFFCAADELVSVNGLILQVPNVTNTEVKLCVFFESSTGSNRIVVFAHLVGDPQKLLAYYLNTTNCTAAPDPGNYIVGVFIHYVGNALKAPATSPNITLSTSEHFLIRMIFRFSQL